MRTFCRLVFWAGLSVLFEVVVYRLNLGLLRWQELLLEIAGLLLVLVLMRWMSRRTEVITVVDKAVLIKFFSKANLIKTSDGRIFVNNNGLLKWNAKDLERKIKVGHRYRIVSYKIDFFDKRNILSVKEIRTKRRRLYRKIK